MVTEETVAFTQQKRRPSKELETKAKLQPSQRYQSIPIEMTIIEPQSVKIQDDCLKSNRRKASVTSIKSSSDKASNVTGLNEGKKKNGKSVIKEEVPCTSSQTSQTKDAKKNSQQEAENNTKSNAKRSHLWRRLKMKLPLIIALRQPRAQTTAPPKRRASMFASREEVLHRISANDNLQERKSSPNKNGSSKKKLFRSLSLGSEHTVKVEPPDSPTQASNVQHLIAMFKEKIQETDKPTRQLRRESKFKMKQMKRKMTEQEKIKQYSNSPFYNSSSQSSKEETPPKPSQNVDPDKTDPSTEQDKAIQRVISGLRRCSRSMTEDEKQKSYVHLIRRRREVEQMRKQYMQRTGSSVEVDDYACDPPIPADVAL